MFFISTLVWYREPTENEIKIFLIVDLCVCIKRHKKIIESSSSETKIGINRDKIKYWFFSFLGFDFKYWSVASTQINVIPNHDYQRTQFAPTKDSTRENDDEEKRYIQFNDKKESDFFCTTRDLTIVECHVSIQFQQKSSFSISNSSSSSFNSHIQTAISSRNQMCLIWHFNLILWQKERSDECSRMKFKASLTPHQPSSSSSKAIL